MDLRLQGNPQPHFRVNGGGFQSPRPGDDALQFLSQEEQECIQFFEKTIDSLEESLEENDQRRRQVKPPPPPSSSSSGSDDVHGPKTSSPSPSVIVSSLLARHPGPKDQDIIDLVRLEPDLVQSTERTFNPMSPDFQSMAPAPESHFEIKPKREHADALPSEYNPPLPGGSYGSADGHSYHPPGCIPTPVLIAQKIAEHQTGGSSNPAPSSLPRRSSLESEKPPSASVDPPVKQAPPTSAKPTRFPANISVVLASKEPQNPALTSVNIEERRKKMLANLTGPHPLLQDESPDGLDEKDRSGPKRSISFKDPAPDKSRMEALSKLGLTRGRASSGGTEAAPGGETSAKPPEEHVPPQRPETSTRSPETRVAAPHQSQENRDPLPSPPPPQATPQSSYTAKTETRTKPEVKAPAPHQSETRRDSLTGQEHRNPRPEPRPVLPPPEVSSLELNRYGGKSIIVNPAHHSKSEPAPPEPKTTNPALAHPSEFNPYGGKTKVLNPGPVAAARNNLPDILSSHINKIQTPPARPDPVPTEFNSYGGKSRTINPSSGSAPVRTVKPPAPIPAPRPPRHAGPAQKPAPRASSPDHKRRPGSVFRPQGVTVQFSGRGATDDSRREALRKLGLLKDS